MTAFDDVCDALLRSACALRRRTELFHAVLMALKLQSLPVFTRAKLTKNSSWQTLWPDGRADPRPWLLLLLQDPDRAVRLRAI